MCLCGLDRPLTLLLLVMRRTCPESKEDERHMEKTQHKLNCSLEPSPANLPPKAELFHGYQKCLFL